MIKELEDVFALLRELPENYQKEAAQSLSWFLKRVEEEMTMTEQEIRELRRMDREASRAKWKKIAREFDEIFGKDKHGQS